MGSGLKGRNTRKNRGERKGKKQKREKRIRRKIKEKKMMDSLHLVLSGPSHLKGDFLKF